MKVLIIGNDLTSEMIGYLPRLAKESGKELLLANLTLKNCSIERHYRNYTDEAEVYTYETYLPGITEKMSPDGIALHEAVEDDDWDLICFIQNPSLGGVRESYKPYLDELAAYCSLMHPEARLALAEPWAYESGFASAEFEKAYGSDSGEMYQKIVSSCVSAAGEAEIGEIIKIGSAWNAAHGADPDILLTKDGVTPNEAGRFLSSLCIYKSVFGEMPGGYIPDEINETTAEFLRVCAENIG